MIRRKKHQNALLAVPEVVHAVDAVKHVTEMAEAWRDGRASQAELEAALDEGEAAAAAAMEKLRELHQ